MMGLGTLTAPFDHLVLFARRELWCLICYLDPRLLFGFFHFTLLGMRLFGFATQHASATRDPLRLSLRGYAWICMDYRGRPWSTVGTSWS